MFENQSKYYDRPGLCPVLPCPAARQDRHSQDDRTGQDKKSWPVLISDPYIDKETI